MGVLWKRGVRFKGNGFVRVRMLFRGGRLLRFREGCLMGFRE